MLDQLNPPAASLPASRSPASSTAPGETTAQFASDYFVSQDGSTPLHLAAMFGSMEGLMDLLYQQPAAAAAMATSVDTCGRLPLHFAAIRGDPGMVAVLCLTAAGASGIAHADEDGMTPLHHACMWGHVKAVGCLLSFGACPTVEDKFQRTPLHYAADKGDVAVVQQLLAANAPVDAADSRGLMPYTVAVLRGHAATVKVIGSAKPASAYSVLPLHAAAAAGDVRAVAALLAEHNMASWELISRSRDLSPLAMAAKMGHVEVVQLLIRAGAQLDAERSICHSPLYLAASKGLAEMVRVLLNAGAKVQETSRDFEGHLYHAAASGHVQVVRVMLEAGATLMTEEPATGPAVRAPVGTVLHNLVKRCKLDALRSILTAGADVNLRNEAGATALHQVGALEFNQQTDYARLLIDFGADLDAVDGKGSTPLHIAVANGNLGVVRTLIASGAALDVKDNECWTPLLKALHMKKRTRIAAELLVAGASLQQADPPVGFLTLQFAQLSGKLVLQYLQKEKQLLLLKVEQLSSIRRNLALLLYACGCAERFRVAASSRHMTNAKNFSHSLWGYVGGWRVEADELAGEVRQLRRDAGRLAGVTARMQEAIVLVAGSFVAGAAGVLEANLL
jgi:ankyrin repeat protein